MPDEIPISPPGEPRKLVLCFDGTGNAFSGSNADTNVVKLLNKLDRNHPNQFHYYQTGIGTYDINATSVDQSLLQSFKSSLDQTLDQGFGSGFDVHVLAGYRFLMRYYESGDKIYLFGFSRGAFTAKFLARMVNKVGLLCKGNEEMVPFVYKLYQRFLAGEITAYGAKKADKKKKSKLQQRLAARNGSSNGQQEPIINGTQQDPDDIDDPTQYANDEISAFSDTFCRKETVIHHGTPEERNIKVFFLGMWDCVSSVAVLEQKAPKPMPVAGTATYVRHAVAVDERRVKFKAALLAQDKKAIESSKGGAAAHGEDHEHEDIKEVWFPGCHGDVGGGWPADKNSAFDMGQSMSFWDRVKNLFSTRQPDHASKYLDKGPFQMSDIPLAWMIKEIEAVGEKEPHAAVHWRPELLARFKKRCKKKEKKEQALTGIIHDSLKYGYGTGFFKVLFWKFLEYLPIITRLEFEKDEWVNVRFPLNKASTRDIPKEAVFHESLLYRLANDPDYVPRNNHGGDTGPCLRHTKGPDGKYILPKMTLLEDVEDHKTYKFTNPGNVG
ncbi:Uncharacterized alpha/beta hydrolase domain (DUF2235) domain containing protein [Rhypophila sp. PSN 637]